MPSTLALLIWLVLLVGLLLFDPAKHPGVSAALWIPVTWMFIVGSRQPSQWFGGTAGLAAQALEDGNSFDRTIYLILIVFGIAILISRGFRWGSFIGRNRALILFLLFGLISVCWSDFPFVAIRRWFRDLGCYVMILLVLTDPLPLEAIRTFLRRVAYLLIPLSIVMIKYYPHLGTHYNMWTGAPEYVGVATSKNTLGAVCLISGLFFFWDIVSRWSQRHTTRARWILLMDAALIAMTLDVLYKCNSATSRVCLILGCVLILAAYSRFFRRRPGPLKFLVPASFLIYLVLALVLNMSGNLAALVGRDPTLTDRTKIWTFLLNMHTNPFVGTGYDSFWLGPRLLYFWRTAGFGGLNEAHNGYLEVYLNLGIIGLILLVIFLIASYGTICKRFTPFSDIAALGMALWAIMLFYSVTEAGFRNALLWLTFMLVTVVLPQRVEEPVRRFATADAKVEEALPDFRFGTVNRGIARSSR
jgi:exopolysaccharide production protein ExoQ